MEHLIDVNQMQFADRDMVNVFAPVKQEPADDVESVQNVSHQWPQDGESVSVVKDEPVPVRCVKQEWTHDMEQHPTKMDMVTVWVPGLPVKQETPEDEEETFVDSDMLASEVVPKIEITIEDHCISLGEGSDTELNSLLEEDVSTMSNLVDATPRLTQSSKGMIGNFDLDISLKDYCDTKDEFKRNEEKSSNIEGSPKVNCELENHCSGHTVSTVNKCIHCDKYFSTVRGLRDHIKLHTAGKNHKCEECGRCFAHARNLKEHLRIHSGEKDHKCGECGKCFSHSGSLKDHLKIHSGMKDHKCAECGKCFTQSGTLRDHLKIHSGEKDHKCAECGKCFTHSRSLRNHLKIHSGEKDHKCGECGKCFTQSGSLKYHLKIHSGEKNYKCSECGKCFTQSGNLRKHLKIHCI